MAKREALCLDISSALLDNNQKVVFLFGAGASIDAGIPGSETLKQNLWNQKLRVSDATELRRALRTVRVTVKTDDNNKIESEVLANGTFEQLMTAASQLESSDTQEKRDIKIAEWLEDQIPDIYQSTFRYYPSFSYEFVCHLMNNGLVQYVISMNYDEILDKAIDDELGKGRCSKVVTLEHFESMRYSSDWNSISEFFLIKPHGTRSMRRSCRYRIDFVENFEEDKREVLERILEDSMLIMIGYESADNDLRNLIKGLGLNRIKNIVIVKAEPARAIENLIIGGSHPTDKISGYEGRDEAFIGDLSKSLYDSDTEISRRYNRFYTKATRHFIRATIYRRINPIGKAKECQKNLIQSNPLFFERLDMLIEIIIYCFKVRGLFTRKALFSCPRIISALEHYLRKAEEKTNPIVDLIANLTDEDTGILCEKKIDSFNSWYYLPKGKTPVLSTLLCKFFMSKSLVEGQIFSHLSYGVCSPVQFHS